MAAPGVPDATFFNPASGLVHVAISEPGLVHSVNTRTGASSQFTTARGAKTTALVAPDSLYVFSPSHHGVFGFGGNVAGADPRYGYLQARFRLPQLDNM